jgi:hypothetical protein
MFTRAGEIQPYFFAQKFGSLRNYYYILSSCKNRMNKKLTQKKRRKYYCLLLTKNKYIMKTRKIDKQLEPKIDEEKFVNVKKEFLENAKELLDSIKETALNMSRDMKKEEITDLAFNLVDMGYQYKVMEKKFREDLMNIVKTNI